MVNDGMSNNCNPFRTPECLFLASELYVLETIVELRFEILPRDVFLCFAGFFEQIYYAFAKKPDKRFWARLRETTFAFVVKRLEHLASRKILCVHRPKFLTVSVVPRYKILREWMRCFVQ